MTPVRDASRPPAWLVLADGTTFEGEAYGAPVEVASGEVVFNTSLTGYQEIITDPSYAGQIITFTYPHIGNYGVTPEDAESRRPFCRGVIIREPTRVTSSWRASEGLESWLARQGIGGICRIDTRRLTRHIREAGSMPGAFGTADPDRLAEAAAAEPGTTGVDLVAEVTTPEPYRFGDGPRRVVALDLGIKRTILRNLSRIATVEVVSATTGAEAICDRDPDGVFLSNGPGDPAEIGYVTDTVRQLLGRVPIFGICLGHQVLGAALGARTYKLPFGHHGGNHPVRRIGVPRVEITAQNHNFAVDPTGVDGIEVTHVNLNDDVVEGIACTGVPAFGVQYHPEAGPGPHDARHLFDEFAELIDRCRAR